MNIKEELRKISVGKQIDRSTMQRTEYIAFNEDTLVAYIEKLVGQTESNMINEIIKALEIISEVHKEIPLDYSYGEDARYNYPEREKEVYEWVNDILSN